MSKICTTVEKSSISSACQEISGNWRGPFRAPCQLFSHQVAEGESNILREKNKLISHLVEVKNRFLEDFCLNKSSFLWLCLARTNSFLYLVFKVNTRSNCGDVDNYKINHTLRWFVWYVLYHMRNGWMEEKLGEDRSDSFVAMRLEKLKIKDPINSFRRCPFYLFLSVQHSKICSSRSCSFYERRGLKQRNECE